MNKEETVSTELFIKYYKMGADLGEDHLFGVLAAQKRVLETAQRHNNETMIKEFQRRITAITAVVTR